MERMPLTPDLVPVRIRRRGEDKLKKRHTEVNKQVWCLYKRLHFKQSSYTA